MRIIIAQVYKYKIYNKSEWRDLSYVKHIENIKILMGLIYHCPAGENSSFTHSFDKKMIKSPLINMGKDLVYYAIV